MTDPEAPMFARTSGTHPMGKLRPMPKVSLADPTVDRLQAMAAEVGMPFSEYVRTILEGHAHGIEFVARVAAERVQRVLGTGVEMEATR